MSPRLFYLLLTLLCKAGILMLVFINVFYCFLLYYFFHVLFVVKGGFLCNGESGVGMDGMGFRGFSFSLFFPSLMCWIGKGRAKKKYHFLLEKEQESVRGKTHGVAYCTYG